MSVTSEQPSARNVTGRAAVRTGRTTRVQSHVTGSHSCNRTIKDLTELSARYFTSLLALCTGSKTKYKNNFNLYLTLKTPILILVMSTFGNSQKKKKNNHNNRKLQGCVKKYLYIYFYIVNFSPYKTTLNFKNKTLED